MTNKLEQPITAAWRNPRHKFLIFSLFVVLFVVGCDDGQLLLLKDRCSEPGVYCEDVYKTINDTVSQDLNSSVTLGYGSNDTFVENYSG